jgi:hypothetical protein
MTELLVQVLIEVVSAAAVALVTVLVRRVLSRA